MQHTPGSAATHTFAGARPKSVGVDQRGVGDADVKQRVKRKTLRECMYTYPYTYTYIHT